MSSATVRVRSETQARLRELAEQYGQSLTDVLENAVELYHRQAFLEGLSNDFAALRADPKAWQEELAERAEWDATG